MSVNHRIWTSRSPKNDLCDMLIWRTWLSSGLMHFHSIHHARIDCWYEPLVLTRMKDSPWAIRPYDFDCTIWNHEIRFRRFEPVGPERLEKISSRPTSIYEENWSKRRFETETDLKLVLCRWVPPTVCCGVSYIVLGDQGKCLCDLDTRYMAPVYGTSTLRLDTRGWHPEIHVRFSMCPIIFHSRASELSGI